MRLRRQIPRSESKHIIADPEVHAIIKGYAKEHNLTMREATYFLLGKALDLEASKRDSGNG